MQNRGWTCKRIEQDTILRNNFRFSLRPIVQGGIVKAHHCRFLGNDHLYTNIIIVIIHYILDESHATKVATRAKMRWSERGVMVLYLPPYCYDFSPIEIVFHVA